MARGEQTESLVGKQTPVQHIRSNPNQFRKNRLVVPASNAKETPVIMVHVSKATPATRSIPAARKEPKTIVNPSAVFTKNLPLPLQQTQQTILIFANPMANPAPELKWMITVPADLTTSAPKPAPPQMVLPPVPASAPLDKRQTAMGTA